MFSVPGLRPGARMPPLARETLATWPVPFKAPPEFTSTVPEPVALPLVLVTLKVPLTVVLPL